MSRDHARVNLAIWSDPEFAALPPAAQHLYLTLWTSPDLTYCGTHDWRPGRLAAKSRGWTGEHIRLTTIWDDDEDVPVGVDTATPQPDEPEMVDAGDEFTA